MNVHDIGDMIIVTNNVSHNGTIGIVVERNLTLEDVHTYKVFINKSFRWFYSYEISPVK